MLSVQPLAWDEAEEELRSVCVWSGVGHGQISSLGVLHGEVLVWEFHAVDGLTSGSVSSGEISTLGHEFIDDSVERGSLEVKWLSGFSNTFLTSAKASEVLSSVWNLVSKELNGDSASLLTTNSDIEENSRV